MDPIPSNSSLSSEQGNTAYCGLLGCDVLWPYSWLPHTEMYSCKEEAGNCVEEYWQPPESLHSITTQKTTISILIAMKA